MINTNRNKLSNNNSKFINLDSLSLPGNNPSHEFVGLTDCLFIGAIEFICVGWEYITYTENKYLHQLLKILITVE